MKKILVGSIIGFFILFGLYLLIKFQLRENKFKNFEIINYKIQNKTHKLLVVCCLKETNDLSSASGVWA